MAKIAMQVSGAFLRFDEHVARSMKSHLDKVVMLGLGFEPDSFDTYRIRSGTGHALTDAVTKIAGELVKDHARTIFAKVTKGKTRAKLVDLVRTHFKHSYRQALLAEIRSLINEEVKGVEKEIQRELDTEVPKNFKLVMEPIIEAVRNSTLEQLASGRYTSSYGETIAESLESQLALERNLR
jgi:hypothetical protein